MIRNKKVLSVITARAGSRGVPGKNYKELMGKPLFMWSVLASVDCQHIDKTVISSNCEVIRKMYTEMVLEHKDKMDDRLSKVCFTQRPEEMCGDLSKNEDALIHAYNWEKEKGEEFDIVVNLQPTSPCRFDFLLDNAIYDYHRGGYDSLLTATRETPFVWQKIDEKWKYTVDKHECCNRKMRQEFDESDFIFHDCGSVYITDAKILLDKQCRIGYNPLIFEVAGMLGIQIDNEEDFLLIEKMAEALKLKYLHRRYGGY